jgi:hypothetical protein
MAGFCVELEFQLGSTRLVWFKFNPSQDDVTDDLEEIVTEYTAGDAVVEPREFIEAQKKVREQLYDFLGTRGDRRIAS